MSQVSYGTITIVDTTDIERIYMVYAKSVSNTIPPSDELTWSESIASAPGEGDFIWQKTVVEKAITEEKTYSDPVCVTGSSGQGVEKIINYYCNYGQGQPEEDYSGWQLEIPEYDSNKPNYWTKVVVIYSDDTREDFQASGTIATFESEKVGVFDSLEVALSPIQDLHGYDRPWVGGAGKNLLDLSWFGTRTNNGLTFTYQSNDKITVTGTAVQTSWTYILKSIDLPYNGISAGDTILVYSNAQFYIRFLDANGQYLDGRILTQSDRRWVSSTIPQETAKLDMYYYAGYTLTEAGQTYNDTIEFYMSKDLETKVWTPYSNICPISGHDSVDVSVCGKNLLSDKFEDYQRPVDYYVCPVKLEQGASYTATIKLKDGGTPQTGFTIGIARHGDRYTDFGTFVIFANQSTNLPKSIVVTINQTFDDPRFVLYTTPRDQQGFESFFDNYEVQFEKGLTATDYEPYQEQSYHQDIEVTYTPTVQENDAYLFKQTGDVGGDRETIELVGGTVAWNQLAEIVDYPSPLNGVTFTVNGDGSVTVNGTASGNARWSGYLAPAITGHVYYSQGCPSGGSDSTYRMYSSYTGVSLDRGSGRVVKHTSSTSYPDARAEIFISSGYTANNLVFKPQYFDLTAMFGSTIANYIYSLEQANAGAGVAWFKKLFPKPYYAYNAGELMSVQTSAHNTVGFNQWDEEWELGALSSTGGNATSSTEIRAKNYIPVVGGQTYFLYCAVVSTFNYKFYDADKNFISGSYISRNNTLTIPNDARYMRFYMGAAYGTTYNNDICINISDPSRNGEYEPYVKHEYALDSDLELRGMPKLDSANNLYYDGDVYEPDGTVTRKYGVVDLGTLDWVYSNNYFRTSDLNSTIKRAPSQTIAGNVVCNKYLTKEWNSNDDKVVLINNSSSGQAVLIKDTSYTDAASFKSAMSGVYLVYELATPTTETAEPFEEIQICSPYGTEEFADNRAVPIPVGNNTQYLTRDIYGGTLDVVSGVLTVDRAMVDLGSFNWTRSTTAQSGKYRFSASPVSGIKKATDFVSLAHAISSQYATASWVDTYNCVDGTLGSSPTTETIAVFDSNHETATVGEFKTAISGVQLCYELATPTTIQLTTQQIDSLLGRTNVWSDGTVEVEGHTISKKDIMIYKDNGLTDVANKSAEANTSAAEALEKANDGIISTTQLWYQTNSTGAPNVPSNHSQVDQGTVTYNNWRSVRPNNSVDSYKYYYYCYEYLHGDGTYTYSAEAILDTSNLSQYQIDQLQTRIKKMWSNSTGSYMASGIGTNEVNIDNSSTYGFNSKSTTTGVSFNYNAIPLTSLGTDGIKLYSPTLTNGVITSSRLDATLNTNGLILNKGGIKAGEGTSNFIYLSTDPYGNYSINGSSGISDWKQIIGTKFGVRADGTLYASNANISGKVTVVGSGSNVYTTQDVDGFIDGAKKIATNYITEISDGIFVHAEGTPEDPTNVNAKGVRITDETVDIIKEGKVISQYGQVTQIGESESSSITIRSNGLSLLDRNGNTAFYIEAGGNATIVPREVFMSNFFYSFPKNSSVILDDLSDAVSGTDIVLHTWTHDSIDLIFEKGQSSSVNIQDLELNMAYDGNKTFILTNTGSVDYTLHMSGYTMYVSAISAPQNKMYGDVLLNVEQSDTLYSAIIALNWDQDVIV